MTDTFETLRSRRGVLEQLLEDRGLLHTVSAARFQLNKAIENAIESYATGAVLEAGAGRSPNATTLAERASSVTTLDIDSSRGVDVVGDVQRMTEVPDESFDAILSTQVLEHVARPQDAFREFARVLRPGGTLILSAPHLSMVHEAPHDYFRFTRFGIGHLCDSSSLEVIEIRPVGGLLSLIGHVVSLGWLTTIGAIPGLFWPAWLLNYVFLVRGVDMLDRMLGLQAILPRDHVLVARRA
jgi:SAM-dependent methyltransferase